MYTVLTRSFSRPAYDLTFNTHTWSEFNFNLYKCGCVIRAGRNVSFPGSWPIFPQFVMCFYIYVQKDKISPQIPRFSPKHQYFPWISLPHHYLMRVILNRPRPTTKYLQKFDPVCTQTSTYITRVFVLFPNFSFLLILNFIIYFFFSLTFFSFL